MCRERLEVENLGAGFTQRGEEAALAAARRAMHDDEFELRRNRSELVDHPAPIRAIPALECLCVPADFAQDVRHRARALAAAPAIDERPPVLIFSSEELLDMPR